MLNTHSLTRSLAARDGIRLVRELERNGLPLGSALATRLAPGWVIPTALGFRRLLEVSHRPSSAARAMLADLLEAQDAAGGFLDSEGFSGAVVTAAALRAVAAASGDRRFAADRERLVDAIARGVVALRREQTPDGWFGAGAGFAGGAANGATGSARGLWEGLQEGRQEGLQENLREGRGGVADRRAASALVYWLVGDEPALRGALDVRALEAAWRSEGEAGAAGGLDRGHREKRTERGSADELAADINDLWNLARASVAGAVLHPLAA